MHSVGEPSHPAVNEPGDDARWRAELSCADSLTRIVKQKVRDCSGANVKQARSRNSSRSPSWRSCLSPQPRRLSALRFYTIPINSIISASESLR
jgi:hypothetical protein